MESEAQVEVVEQEERGEAAALRDLVLRAHPDVVPELVAGSTLGELMASVEPARAAYRRVAETVSAPPRVPAGDTPRLAVDIELLPAVEKIRRGLATRR
jgi:hypothetical protein